MRLRSLRVLLVVGLLGVPLVGARAATTPFADCAPVARPTVVVGSVSCQLVPSTALGAPVPVSYYVPPVCAPGHGRPRCRVVYLLHGFGGDYQSLLGTASKPSAYVKALTSGPPADPRSVSDPWRFADTSGWQPKPALPVVLVAPHGRTLPGGFGPAPDLDGFWSDWNPRYAGDGDTPRYETPAPRFESFLINELIPYVEGHFGVARGRNARALDGESLGGFGSFKNGLQHPDVFASLGSISGAHNFLFTPWLDPSGSSPIGVAPPVATPHLGIPGPGGAVVPLDKLPPQLQAFAVALLIFGDPGVDQTYFRGNMPRDLAANGRAWRGKQQALALRFMHNDTIPRRDAELTTPRAPRARSRSRSRCCR
jgi:hypothetical protein